MELIIFIAILLVFGFFAYPLIVWFTFIGLYSFLILDAGILFAIVYIAFGVLFLKERYTTKVCKW